MAESFCFAIVSDEFSSIILSLRNQNQIWNGEFFLFLLGEFEFLLLEGMSQIFPKFDLGYRIFCFYKLQ